jgi:hypothetical protein
MIMKNIIVILMLLIVGQYASAQNPKIMDLCRYADSTKLGSCRAFYTAGDGEPTRFVVNISLYDVHGDNTVLVDRQGRVVDNWDTSKRSELSKRMTQVCEEMSKEAVDAYRVEWHRKLQDVVISKTICERPRSAKVIASGSTTPSKNDCDVSK